MNHRSSFPPPRPFSRAQSRSQPPRDLGERQIEALTVAMILAPGVYVRNRMFDLFTLPGACRARTRASVVRGIVPQLTRATAVTIAGEGRGGETTFVLRYVIAAVRLTRVVELSSAELAALRLVAERARIRCLLPAPNDKDIVSKALASLMDSDVSLDVSRLARDIIRPGE